MTIATPPALLRQSFDQLRPWYTCFKLDGHEYGGKFNLTLDGRVQKFLERFSGVDRVLELGSFEGGHTISIAPHVGSVVAVESRDVNLQKSKFVCDLLGIQNVEFHQLNLEPAELMPLGRFDVLFCCGILYHLPEPWELIRKMADVSDNVFLWTEYAEQPETSRNGYAGRVYQEYGHEDPLSGESPESFWFTRDSLMEAFGKYFSGVEVLSNEDNDHGITAVFRR